MNFTIVGIHPDHIEIWDGKSYTAPGKTVNEPLTMALFIPNPEQYHLGPCSLIIQQEIPNDNPD